ncbi:NAD(P)-dependent dehydrogenase (short-subunit alcohol dehydrogenase family) [Paenibacillus rhizosphaerae]|uniref:NAD(P)-dependent dehydrogenase (Short-subunit alcohol dehydrogenase family) n=1 Tax=Paenibacillus rhizosphaerae TaxID=297318 RepID=A0A839TS10_9BACL|nr:SDR family NAD(P)-dependent oxidoreductase [Paenibacillus rhizosphaerae]MBB3129616.1 NAD(P)-dependent dehydrogenase (short-subunit alcohol dehydrogenase family) [Paenibacillus rhizosphaerae]
MDQIVLITEAHHPWGRALVREFAQKGWRVMACSPVSVEMFQDAFDTDRIHIFTMDMRSRESVQQAVERIQEQTSRVDLLVCGTLSSQGKESAGIANMSADLVLEDYQANALGPIRVIEACLPLMDHGLRRIALLSDVQGSLGLGLSGAGTGYAMSKAALHMAYTMLHGDLGRKGFTFRLFEPGPEPETEVSAEAAAAYFTGSREDEERMVMLDWRGQEVPL